MSAGHRLSGRIPGEVGVGSRNEREVIQLCLHRPIGSEAGRHFHFQISAAPCSADDVVT
jgi:hypothetical protein